MSLATKSVSGASEEAYSASFSRPGIGWWLIPGEPPVPPQTVRIPSAAQIQLPVPGAGKRKLVLGPPLVLAHHKNRHRRFVLAAVVDSFEPVVIPAQFHSVRIHHRLLAEI